MRKFILITAMLLASASAQAADRNLSLDRGAAAATSNAVNASSKVAEVPVAPAVEPPPKPPETPVYVARPAAVAAPAPAPQPQAQPLGQQGSVQASAAPVQPVVKKPAAARKSAGRHHDRTWTEGRIISELHRHGIYW